MLTAVPDPTRRLADGVLVDACLRARVLGFRLLTIEAAVVLVPAAVAPASSGDARPQRPPARSFRAPLPRWSGPPPGRRPTGHALADARRSLIEGAELLAGASRDGPATHPHRASTGAGAATRTDACRDGSSAPAVAASTERTAETPIAATKPSLKSPGDA